MQICSGISTYIHIQEDLLLTFFEGINMNFGPPRVYFTMPLAAITDR